MKCEKLHATVSASTCTSRQLAYAKGLVEYGCCSGCAQGAALARDLEVSVPSVRSPLPLGYRLRRLTEASYAEHCARVEGRA